MQHSLYFLYLKLDGMRREYENIKEDVKTVKLENESLTKNMFNIEELGKEANINLKQIQNLMKETVSKYRVFQLVKIKMLRLLQ